MSTPTPDYGEPWALDGSDGFWNKVINAGGSTVAGVVPTRRAIACVNALTGVQDPAAHLANLNATIEQQAETLKVMNDALKEAHRIFGNLGHSQVVQRLCPDFAEVAELVRKSHDQHA